jgi:hypothetical protein
MHSISSTKQGGFYENKPMYLTQLPIRPINFSDPAEKARHDQIIKPVDRMLDLHKQLASAKTDRDKEYLNRQIESTDNQIDRLVYDLYGLTEDEIKIVEERTK